MKNKTHFLDIALNLCRKRQAYTGNDNFYTLCGKFIPIHPWLNINLTRTKRTKVVKNVTCLNCLKILKLIKTDHRKITFQGIAEAMADQWG